MFAAVDAVNGAMKRSVVTLLGWHALSVDPRLRCCEAGRRVERWADPGALAALERAYAHYDLRDVARALWETIDLFQGLEEETARRLGLAVELDHADLRRRDRGGRPRPAARIYPVAVKRALLLAVAAALLLAGCGDDSTSDTTTADDDERARLLPPRRQGLAGCARGRRATEDRAAALAAELATARPRRRSKT